jgi:hypothetical protein
MHFRKLDLFPSSGEGREMPTLLGPKRCFFWYLEFQTMDKVQKSSNSEHYFPDYSTKGVFQKYKIELLILITDVQ